MAAKTCTWKDCKRPHLAKGFCSMHWTRNRDGRPMDGPPAPGRRAGKLAAPRTTKARTARSSPAREATPATPEDLERFCVVTRALGFDADALLEQAELDFARRWLEELRGRIQVDAAPAPLQLRAPRPLAERPRPPPARSLEPLPATDELDSPRAAPKSTKGLRMGSAECDGCGGVVSCSPGCPVKKHAA